MKMIADTELIEEWSDKNTLSPDKVTAGSGKQVLWVCNLGHEWTCSPNRRTSRNTGCPVCSGRKVQKGYNDLATTHPDIALMWHSKDILPTEVSAGSHKVVEWICRKSHITKCSVKSKVHNKIICPVCTNRQIIKGVNDFVTINPSMSEYSNQALSINSGKKIAMSLPCGHIQMRSPQSIKDRVWCQTCSAWSDRDSLCISSEMVDQSIAISAGSGKKIEWQCKNGHRWFAKVNDRTRRDGKASGCPKCSHRVSSSELEILEYVKSMCPDALGSERTVISPKELDIYIPSKKIAIEYNGLYWHSEKYLDRNVHADKFELCKKAGVEMIAIWEDDWKYKNKIIKDLLRVKLQGRKTIGARRTVLKEVDYSDASKLLDAWHIQGPASGTHYLTLNIDGEPVAIGVFTKRAGVVELTRYASNIGIQGGLDKMMKYLPYSNYITFADHGVSSGSLYLNSGWKLAGVLPADYKYIVGDKREHKFSYRKSRFMRDPGLMYDPQMTEAELAKANGLLRIYDYGKSKFVRSHTHLI